MTKREPVAFDLVELGDGATADDNSAPMLARRPIPSVPDNRLAGAGAGAAAQAMSRMASPGPDQRFRNQRDNSLDKSLYSTPPGLSRPPWVNKHVMAGRLQADCRSDLDNSSVTVEYSSLKKEATDGPSAWDHSAPSRPSHHTMSNSLNRHEDSALAQQARRAAFMHANPLQALRNVARTSALIDEAQLGAHQSRILLGSEPSSSNSTGSGSPVPFYSRMEGNTLQFENGVQSPPRQQQHPIQGANTAAAHALARPPGTGKHPRTAQLTIFYSGMVNVYDDVPFDKAQAIMLLAGTGSAWPSSNYANFPGSCAAISGHPFSTPGGMNQPMSRAGSPAPQMTNPSAGSPLGAVTKLGNRQVTTAGLIVELPQARKASLARFLEKRKDRVRKGPYTHINDEVVKNDPASARNSRENSPSHPFASSKPPTRSPSPPAAGNQTNNVPYNATGAAGQVQMASTRGSEPNSPPQTPPRQSMSEDRSHGMLGRKESDNQNMGTMVARSGKSPPS